ncbi:MAG: septal ring lytic transglycosylase RlpA family lipoprotein [Ignavibacteriae bacterium]|nr:MAG: septal ring lytic transglycosylase RlpA family lipoprotein [Ignavibacteriota bacterium]
MIKVFNIKSIILNYKIIIITFYFLVSCSSSRDYSEYNSVKGKFIESGVASWYGPNFDGMKTANGETFDMQDMTAAHRTLPFGSLIKVVDSDTKKYIIVRINDRGPYAKQRIIDLSKRAAEKLGIIRKGTANVNLYLLNQKVLPSNLKTPHYTVQIGSFFKKDDAINLSKNFNNSFIIQATISKKIYYRVYVGRFDTKQEANLIKRKLSDKGYKGFVKQFEN